MRSISHVFTAFLLVAAIAAPAALARPAQDPPPWPVEPQPTAPAVTQPAPSDDGFPWATAGLILIAAGIGLGGAVAVVRVRRRPHMIP